MSKLAKTLKKLIPVSETPAEAPVEVKKDVRDAEFYKRHPGALDGVIYE